MLPYLCPWYAVNSKRLVYTSALCVENGPELHLKMIVNPPDLTYLAVKDHTIGSS
jgi:hypothetical protein